MLRLHLASGASVASQGAPAVASAISADQPVDLAARPKSSPSAASPSTPKPVTATLQVRNTHAKRILYFLLIRYTTKMSEGFQEIVL